MVFPPTIAFEFLFWRVNRYTSGTVLNFFVADLTQINGRNSGASSTSVTNNQWKNRDNKNMNIDYEKATHNHKHAFYCKTDVKSTFSKRIWLFASRSWMTHILFPWRRRSGCVSAVSATLQPLAGSESSDSESEKLPKQINGLSLQLTGPSIIMDGVPTPLRCFSECHSAEKFADDGVETVTSVEQVSGLAPLGCVANAN